MRNFTFSRNNIGSFFSSHIGNIRIVSVYLVLVIHTFGNLMQYAYHGDKYSLSIISLFNPASILALLSGYLINKKYEFSTNKEIYKKISLFVYKYVGWIILYYSLLFFTKSIFNLNYLQNISSFTNENYNLLTLLVTPKNHLWYLNNLLISLILFLFFKKNKQITILILLGLPIIYYFNPSLEEFLKFRFIYFFIWGIIFSNVKINLLKLTTIFILSIIFIYIFNKEYLLNITTVAFIFLMVINMSKLVNLEKVFVLINRRIIFLIYFFHTFFIKLLVLFITQILKYNFESFFTLSIFSLIASILIFYLIAFFINKINFILNWDIYL